jgi:hypothetical protein
MSVKLTPSAEVSTLLGSRGRAVSVPTSVESIQSMFENSASTPRDAWRDASFTLGRFDHRAARGVRSH